jgi:hypothetical protein
MIRLMSLCLLLLISCGCRFSVTADKLGLSVQADQPGHLSTEDTTTYTDEPAIDPDTVNK